MKEVVATTIIKKQVPEKKEIQLTKENAKKIKKTNKDVSEVGESEEKEKEIYDENEV